MVTSLLLLAVLFLVGFVNVYFYFSPKKFSAWLQSFLPAANNSSVSSSMASSAAPSDKGKLISESKKVDLKRVFATFDKNGDGFITKQELRESLKNIRMFISEKEVEDMVVKVDANGDGLIDFDEFCILCQGSTTTTMGGSHLDHHEGSSREINGVADEEHDDEEGTEGELKEAFDVFDKDKDGLISVEELGSVLCSLGLKEGNKMEDCKAMIRKVDMDGDGMVNFDEFKRMMKSSGGGLVSVTAF